MSLDLDAIGARAANYAHAIGPAGEKAWLAGQLAADVPALLAEVDRLRDELGNARDWERVEREAAELAVLRRFRDGMREQWAALYPDGTWTSGADLTSRAEAQDIVDDSRIDPPPRLARRWVSDWQAP